MPHSPEAEVAAVIHRYIEGYIKADAVILRDVFAHDAVMNGYVGERLVEGSPDPFILRVASETPLAAQGLALSYDITFLEVTGSAASVVLKEYGFGAFNFTDYMHLLKRDGVGKLSARPFRHSDRE